MDIRKTDNSHIKKKASNAPPPASLKHFKIISKGRKVDPARSQQMSDNNHPFSNQSLHRRLINAISKLPSIPLRNRDAQKPSLTVLEQFLQLFLQLFTPQATETEPLIKVHAGKFSEFLLDPQILPPGLKNVPQDLLIEEVSKKIQSGGLVYEKIATATLDPTQPTLLEDISNLMWFLQAKAEQKVGPFHSIVISIEDPELHLLSYLDSCKEVYQRLSPYIEQFQSFQGENSGVHRGIDFNYSAYNPTQSLHQYLTLTLPYRKASLLIAPMLKESGLIEDTRLLLKMENHGAYHYRPKDGDRPFAPSSRGYNEFDFGNAVGHAWGLIQSQIWLILGAHTKSTSKSERIPPYICDAYKRFIDEFEVHKSPEFLTVLKKNDPLAKSSGIRIMARNIENLILLSSHPDFPSHFTKPLKDFYNTITDYEKYDHYHVRIGNEVIFNTKDLLC